MLKPTESGVEKRWDNAYNRLTNYVSDEVAKYVICAALDISYRTDIEADGWNEYLEKLKKKCGGVAPAFRSGVIDIRTAIKESLDNQERWIAEWGKGADSKPYTEDDYRRLDEIFSTFASRPERSGGMDALQDFNLHTCAKLQLLAEKCIAKGGKDDLAQAEKAINSTQKLLEAEQLRKKDVVPWQEMTLDGITDRLRKEGLSAEMSLDEVRRYICKQLRREGIYDFTVDAAEHMLLAIQNTQRINDDEPELDELPVAMRFTPELTRQFSSKPNDTEKEVYEYLGYKRFPWNEPKKKGKKGKTEAEEPKQEEDGEDE